MLLQEDGTLDQMLTGGCLEQHLKDDAKEFCSGQKRLLYFDMSADDDALLGWGAGCQGKMTILVEPMTEELRLQGSISDTTHERSFTLEWVDQKLNRGSLSMDGEVISGTPDGEVIFTFMNLPKCKVLIFGAGPDGARLNDHLTRLGLNVHLYDHRAVFDQALLFNPDQVLDLIKQESPDIVVIMTHNFLVDQKILHALSQCPPLKILLLGPKERKAKLMLDLHSSSLDSMIEAPLGVIEKARGSEEIALSAAASILSFWKKRVQMQLETIEPSDILRKMGWAICHEGMPSGQPSREKNQVPVCPL